MQSYIFLILISIIGLLSKNKIVMYAALSLIVIKLIPNINTYLVGFKSKGLKFGIFLITLAILVPIATGDIGFKDLIATLKNRDGIIALIVGIFASYLATKGINLQEIQPQIAVFVSLGIITGVVLIGGSAVGPIVASGITYLVLKLINYLII